VPVDPSAQPPAQRRNVERDQNGAHGRHPESQHRQEPDEAGGDQQDAENGADPRRDAPAPNERTAEQLRKPPLEIAAGQARLPAAERRLGAA
jgi:hypothetical protein